MGICVATGDNTIFGRIAKLTNQPKTGMTTLQREIFRFVLIISLFIVCVVITVIVVWYVFHEPNNRSRVQTNYMIGQLGYDETTRTGLMFLC